jgi:rare lipoprotein A
MRTASGRTWARGGARPGCFFLALALAACGETGWPAGPAPPAPAASAPAAAGDQSGREEVGKASIYSKSFDGKPMADGTRYSPDADVAASRTLPLGTVAKVTNLENGKSVEVRVGDRGPFTGGRVVDLTPKTADKLGLTKKQGVARVAVKPIKVPKPGGGAKPAGTTLPHQEVAATGTPAP